MLRQDLNVITVILIINTIYFEPAIIVLCGYHLTSKYVLLSQTVRTARDMKHKVYQQEGPEVPSTTPGT
jgi:hypothetical protein